MAPFRLVSNYYEDTTQPPAWYVERYTADGRTEIVSHLFLKRWDAQAEAERLRALEPDPDA
jgi:hypothetical protein